MTSHQHHDQAERKASQVTILRHRTSAVEAPPDRPRAVPAAPLPPLPLGAPARSVGVLADLRAETPDTFFNVINDRPIPHANWDAWLADDWAHIDARWDNLADGTARVFARMATTFAEYAPRALFAPPLSELTELVSVQLPEWRKALTVHAEAELALYDAEVEVA